MCSIVSRDQIKLLTNLLYLINQSIFFSVTPFSAEAAGEALKPFLSFYLESMRPVGNVFLNFGSREGGEERAEWRREERCAS